MSEYRFSLVDIAIYTMFLIPVGILLTAIVKEVGCPKRKVFEGIIDRTEFIVNTGTIVFGRKLNEYPYSEGLKCYPKAIQGWYPAVIRCDDARIPGEIDGKSDIYFPMFYSEGFNPDWMANGWAQTDSVVVVDCALAGAYRKEIVVDGKFIGGYVPGGKSFFWIHYNLDTGEVKAY